MKKLLTIFFLFSFAYGQSAQMMFHANNYTASSGTTAFITSNPSGSLRNNYSDYVGFEFTVGSSAITVTDLGRWVVSGNSGTHTIKITDASNNTIVSASINTSGLSVGYNYVSCTPTVLSASTSYYIFSLESNGGDQWYDAGSTYTHASDATMDIPAYISGGTINVGGSVNNGYVPPNFKYHL